KQRLYFVQRYSDQQVFGGFAKTVPANLREIQVEESSEISCELVPVKRDVSEPFLRIPGRINCIVLNAAACGDLNLASFDEGSQSPGHSHASTGDLLLRDEKAVQERVDIIL